ncbi:hypothetical protein VNI00_013950 [Paramarasmius palmivorus]|uniref:Uncharacterized protein n=1 Tax=Paramarasmius palmivorus TaxID=297713 RepID=A0AAW0BVU7_9AGAR
MGGLALYDEDEYVCHLWDRNAFNDIIVVSEGDKEQNVESQGPNGRDTKLATLIVNGRPFKGDTKSFKSSVQQLIVGKHIHEKQRYSCLLEFLLAKGHIRITEEEIKDKGHADALTKTIAITQTTWFILQCSARAVQGLDVTALEVFTFAFAVLNFVTYFLWWNKPLRVRHPVRVYWRPQPPKLRDQIGETPPWYRRLWKGLSAAMPMLYKECAQGFDAVSEYIAKDFKYLAETKNLRPLKCPFGIGLLFYPIVSLYTRFEEFMIGYDSDELRYLFSSRLDKDPLGIHITAFMVAVIFGAIQCIPWFFPFPTPVERLTWTIIAVVMLAGPVAFGTLYLFIRCLISKWMERQLGNSEWTRAILKKVKIWKDQKRSTHLLKVLAIYWTVAYVAGRSALIVLALLALRGLSRQGYEAVEWNAFFPHIG